VGERFIGMGRFSLTAAWHARGQTRSADHAVSIRKTQGGIARGGETYVSSDGLASLNINSDGNA